MRFFDALKRKKIYISSGVKDLEIKINSDEYLKIDVGDRYRFIEERVNKLDIDNFANNIVLIIQDGEEIIFDEELFDIFSSIIASYARRFPKQKAHVATPSNKIMEGLPATPVSLILLMSTHVVNKPIQITAKRYHKGSDSYEEVNFIR